MINKALDFYDFINPKAELIRHNENMTFKITDVDKSYVLRIHKPIEGFNLAFLRMGKNAIDQIYGEMELLAYLAGQKNLFTQKVKANKNGNIVTVLEDKTPVTVLEWLDGKTLENIEITETIALKIGIMLGELHSCIKNVTVNNRYNYDKTLLLKMAEETEIAVNKGHFGKKHGKIIINTLLYIKDYFTNNNKQILVHSDLSKSNLIYHNDTVVPIDFSLSGYCIPEMDLASVFSHINNNALNEKILCGYTSISDIKPSETGIDICFCLQILLFIIIQHNKIAGEPWLENKLDDWCENQFIPLLDKKTIVKEQGFIRRV